MAIQEPEFFILCKFKCRRGLPFVCCESCKGEQPSIYKNCDRKCKKQCSKS